MVGQFENSRSRRPRYARPTSLMINTWDQSYAAPPNFVKISGAHRMTPAMAAGVESRLWEIGDIVKVVEAWKPR